MLDPDPESMDPGINECGSEILANQEIKKGNRQNAPISQAKKKIEKPPVMSSGRPGQ
jgi:hypothetical protein